MSANEVTWETDHGDEVEVWRAGLVYGQDETTEVWRWRVRAAGNGEIVGGGEAHPRKADAIAAAKRHHPPVERP